MVHNGWIDCKTMKPTRLRIYVVSDLHGITCCIHILVLCCAMFGGNYMTFGSMNRILYRNQWLEGNVDANMKWEIDPRHDH